MTALAMTSHDSTAPAPAVPVRARGLCKTIDDRPILKSLDLEFGHGRFVTLLGANGAGKSTLLKLLSTLTTPTGGQLEMFGLAMHSGGGAVAAKVRAQIGLIGHQTMLYHDLSACENLEFFGTLYGLKQARQRALELLDVMGLSARANDPVKAFSRGMQQRVAIARALMHNPELLLADEPFAGLDAPSAAMLEKVLRDLHRAGKTIVLANHDIGQSLRLADRAVVLRGGRKVIDAATSELSEPQVLAEMSGGGKST